MAYPISSAMPYAWRSKYTLALCVIRRFFEAGLADELRPSLRLMLTQRLPTSKASPAPSRNAMMSHDRGQHKLCVLAVY